MYIYKEELDSIDFKYDLAILDIISKDYSLSKYDATNGELFYISTKYNSKINCLIHYYNILNNILIENEVIYLNLLKKILDKNELVSNDNSSLFNIRKDRTNTGTLSIFGEQLRFNIENNKIPVLTTKWINWKSVIIELIWFLNGDTNTKFLTDNNVHIWDGNSTREFLDNRGLTHLEEGNIGEGYGFQWRNFNGDGIDQIKNLIDGIISDPYGRRHILTAWNPAGLHKMSLPPCHCFAQFYITNDNHISCHMYQRSVDVFLGLPFNIISYSILTYLIGIKTGYTPKELIISTGDTHIYSNHVDQVLTQLSRTPFCQPTLNINVSKINKSDYLRNLDINEWLFISPIYKSSNVHWGLCINLDYKRPLRGLL
jgi:thymidylate synthase